MDRKNSDLHTELLKKRLYESVVNSFFTGNSVPRVGDGILNGYLAEFVAIGNVNGSKFFKPHPVLQISPRKFHKTPKDYTGIYSYQDALEDIPEEQTDFTDMLGSCPDHKNEILKYFCETCDEPICLDCTMVDHRKHRFSYLRDVYHRQQHNVGALLTQGRTQIESTRKCLNEVKTMLSCLQDEKEGTEKAIQEHAQKLIKTLEHQAEELMLELRNAYEKKEVTLRKEKQHLELMLEQLNGSCHCAEKAIKIGNELEILVIQKHLKRKLNDVKNTRKDFNSASFQKICYFTKEDSLGAVKDAMGRVTVSETCPDLSIAKGEGLVRGQKGSPTSFMITAKTYNNEPCKSGGDPVSVKVQTPNNDIIEPRIQDEGTGNYSVSFTPSESGNHQVDVEINKQPIRDSPFIVKVSNPRDYSQITRPSLVFGSLGESKGKLNLPLGVAVNNGSILIADCHNHRIQIFDSEGHFLRCFGTFGDKAGQLNNPSDVAVDNEGIIVVCDKDNHRIQRFNKDGIFLSKFGGLGEKPGRFKRPWGVTVNEDNEIVVTDRRNNRIQVFDKNGSHLKTIGCYGHGEGNLNQPYYAVVSRTGDIYVTDSNNHRVQVFDVNGNYLREFGNDSTSDSQLKYPTGIAFDDEGHVLVGDQYHHRIQVYTTDGALLASLSSGLNGLDWSCYPKGLAVSPDGRVVVVDSDNNRVIVL
ncbi:E3 ubiquitin-protein ligase TRIM71 [Exaiptasia diaphana]|uniref:B box-type domain-containing protein n=1 Tax=Exaiptasia diaphana TaxID=2652724 RepID=A0A913YW41_EXADI|nr:E3 ubiquitin-protein ligase TRIM71 [Exaiptasia diaphana]XP_020917590.1 E3 ubiquitin-protein ligase TRIM71 [Exaiptasia diaphana]XP_028519735.1 E3 ubiquitin-protein ligase TRIM71 [Exaiptasia diaphana]KXJ21154.1 E3 ubiquitin-protein ligase TRIM71 [Exaiptasia diaphana]